MKTGHPTCLDEVCVGIGFVFPPLCQPPLFNAVQCIEPRGLGACIKENLSVASGHGS